jgi:glyoxylase-like metal-dependent hydrolase (beta-lactamase superfamily II)
MLLPRISTNVSVWPSEPDSDPVGEFLASLALFDELPDDTRVLPSHGVPFRGIAPRVAELRRHHQTRLDKLAALCGQPRTAAQILPELFQRKLDEHQIIFALGETIAHLNYLMHRGVLERVNEDGVQRFVRRTTPPGARRVIS